MTNDEFEQDCWQTFTETRHRLITGDGSQHDRRAYLPCPDEIKQRYADIQWLKWLGMNNDQISSVMTYDNPPIEVVVRLVDRHGVDGILQRLEPWLERTKEYG